MEPDAIARHACLKHSGRIGRSAAAKELDPDAVDLAVAAHVRHTHTGYDELLMQGLERNEARQAVEADVKGILKEWRQTGSKE